MWLSFVEKSLWLLLFSCEHHFIGICTKERVVGILMNLSLFSHGCRQVLMLVMRMICFSPILNRAECWMNNDILVQMISRYLWQNERKKYFVMLQSVQVNVHLSKRFLLSYNNNSALIWQSSKFVYNFPVFFDLLLWKRLLKHVLEVYFVCEMIFFLLLNMSFIVVDVVLLQ